MLDEQVESKVSSEGVIGINAQLSEESYKCIALQKLSNMPHFLES